MEPNAVTANMLGIMKRAKAFVAQCDGVDADLPTAALLLHEGVAIASLPIVGDRHRLLCRAVALTDADQVVVACDAYGSFEDVAEGESGEAGNLATRFASGDPRVSEVLSVLFVDRDGRAAILIAPYRYEDSRLVWEPAFGENVTPDDIDGRIRVAVELGWQMQLERETLPLTGTALAHHLGVEIWSPMFNVPPLEDSCPCGSGVKARDCCWEGVEHVGS